MKKTATTDAEKQRRFALAQVYTRLFNTPDGKTVLRELRLKHNPRAPRFINYGEFNPCVAEAAFRDGAASVVLDIEDAIEAGRMLIPPTETQNTQT
jgi:hypothetical protein